MITISTTEYVLLAALTAFLVCIFSIPSIIKVADMKHLYDEPDERKSHKKKIPTLGGLAMFAGIMIAITLFSGTQFMERRFITCALIIIFFIGMKDDIILIAPLKKMIGQIIAVSIVVILGKVRLTGFYGFLGIHEIHESFSIMLSIFTILVIMNGFNLIDGIDGLAASTGVVVSTFFGFWFFINGAEYQQEWALLSFVLTAVLLAFLYYNLTPAKIFMGDTGSLISGLIIGVLTIKFIDVNPDATRLQFNSVPIVAFSILIVPLFDTLRVFTLRVLAGKSPLHPDQNHIHHRLLALGLTHLQSTSILVIANILIIALVYLMQPNVNAVVMLLLLIGLCSFLSYIPSIILKKRASKK
ncbi:MAG: glycosyltransferase family 4 protein [Flavobacteriales bacterium]